MIYFCNCFLRLKKIFNNIFLINRNAREKAVIERRKNRENFTPVTMLTAGDVGNAFYYLFILACLSSFVFFVKELV